MELSLEVGVVRGQRGDAGETTSRPFVLALVDEPTRSLEKARHAGGEDQGPDEVDGDGDLRREVVLAALVTLSMTELHRRGRNQ